MPLPPVERVCRALVEEWVVALACSVIIAATGVGILFALPGPVPEESVRLRASPEDQALTDMSPDAGAPGLSIPARPAEWQKPGPPCNRGEHAIRGACYQRYPREDMAPPCEAGIYEHEGQCWRAIRTAPRSPSSVEQSR